MRSSSGVPQAAVQLVGSILQFDVAANTVNLTLEALKLPALDERRLRKSIQGQMTQAVRGLNSAKRADIEAATTAIEDTLKGFKVSEAALRASADSARLKTFIIASNPRPFELISEDAAAVDCFHLIMSAVVGRMTLELRNSQNAAVPLIIEAHDRIAGLDATTSNLEYKYSSIIREVELLGQRSFYNENLAGEAIDAFRCIKGLDCRPKCSLYIESKRDYEQLDELLTRHGIASVWGPPLSGRFELLRQWCQRAGKRDVVVVDCRTEGGLQAGISALARKHHVQPQRTTALTLNKICLERSGITVVLDGLESDSDLLGLEEQLRPGPSAVLATLDFQPRRKVASAFRPQPLGEDEIATILRSELDDEQYAGSIDGLDEVAELLAGQPLLAKQAASYIADCCESIDEYRKSVDENPGVTYLANTRTDERTAQAVWSFSLARVEKRLTRQGICALAILSTLSGKAVVGAWEGAVSFLLSGEELGNEAVARGITKYLSRLNLVDESNGLVNSAGPFLHFAWEQLSNEERTSSVEATLRLIRLAASSARTSRDVGLMNGVVPVVAEKYFDLRKYSPALFDDATLSAGICLGEAGLEQFAIWVLDKLLRLQATDEHPDVATTLVTIASIGLDKELIGASRFALAVAEEVRETKDPGTRVQSSLLTARALWADGDLRTGLDAASTAVRLIEEGAVAGDDAILMGMQAYRFRGWFRVALGTDVRSGIGDLCRAIEIGQTDDRFWFWSSEARAHTVSFLTDRGITPPGELFEEQTSPSSPSSAVPLVTSALGAAIAESHRVRGNIDKAESSLGESPQVGFGELDIACNAADHLQRRIQLLIDRIDSSPWNNDSYSLLNGGLVLADDGLERLVTLPEELAQCSRVKRIRAGLKVNRSAILLQLDDVKQAVAEAREALAIDLDEFGDKHREFAKDALALGIALVADNKVSEARAWLQVAYEIFSRPGPHTDKKLADYISSFLR